MEVYENINTILKEKNVTKRWFAKRLRELEPKFHSTGEIPTEKAIYWYLNGTSQLKIELIPYICEILNISESELFNYKENLKNYLAIKETKTQYNPSDEYDKLISLLPYAPKPMVNKLIVELEKIKNFTEGI